ncbi:hypothetical protein ACET3Z_012702 [Daucus carota]
MHNVCLQVKLCGHATLAASHFIFSSGLVKVNVIEFMTLSGVLTARRVSLPEVSVLSQLKSDGFCIELDFPVVPLVEYTSGEVSNISQSLNGASLILSQALHIVPWHPLVQKLGNSDLVAYQASTRGGFIRLHLDERNQRVMLQGKAVTVMEGSLLV